MKSIADSLNFGGVSSTSLALLAFLVSSQVANAARVNIARSQNVLVTVGSIHQDRAPSDKAYGPINLFDGGEHTMNGTKYDYWYSADAQDFIRLRFKDPVNVEGLALELPSQLTSAPVPEFSVYYTQKGNGLLKELVAEGSHFKGLEWSMDLTSPLNSVDSLEFRFVADKPIAIAEVEVFGSPLKGELSGQGKPSLDPKGFQTADVVRSQKLRPFRRQALEALLQMKWIAEALPKEASKPGKAKFWYDLNKYADDLQIALEGLRGIYNQKGELIDRELLTPPSARVAPRESMRHLARRSTAFGIPIDVCEPTESWSVSDLGFRKYLELHPNGPRADRATWFGPLGQGPRCREPLEGFVENTREMIRLKVFMLLFPKSTFLNAAAEKVDDLEEVRNGLLEDQPDDVKELAEESMVCALVATEKKVGRGHGEKNCGTLATRLEERRRKRCDNLCQETLVNFSPEMVGLDGEGGFETDTPAGKTKSNRS